MATLYIAELETLTPTSEGGAAQVGRMPPVAEQTVAIGGTSASSSAFNSRTRFIRVHADAICSIAIGPTPTASAANARMAADQTEYFGVTPGNKIAVITNS